MGKICSSWSVFSCHRMAVVLELANMNLNTAESMVPMVYVCVYCTHCILIYRRMYVRMHPNQEGCIRMYVCQLQHLQQENRLCFYAVQCTYIRTDVHFRVTYIRIYVYCPVCTLSTQFINCHLFPIFLSLLSCSLDRWTNW